MLLGGVRRGSRSEGALLGPDARTFPVLGNAGSVAVGDCTIVALDDVVRAEVLTGHLRLGPGRHPGARRPVLPVVTTARAESVWRSLNGGTSAGLSDARLLTAWGSRGGLLGTRIDGRRLLDLTDAAQIEEAIRTEGAVYATLAIPLDTAGLYGRPWPDPITTTALASHAIALVGWTSRGFIAATWGSLVLVPTRYLLAYGESAWAVHVVTASRSPHRARRTR